MPEKIDAFLAAAGWADATRRPLAGDASARRYERLARPSGGRAVLMISPAADEISRFSRIDRWLRAAGFSAPEIFAEDAAAGLMLLEDLGDDLLSRLLHDDPAREGEIYAFVTDFLLDLHRLPAPEFVAPLDGPALAELVELTVAQYPTLSQTAAEAVPGAIAALYAGLAPVAPVLCLRDFHAENALWLPERRGTARLGLLDFQDAVAAHPAYDLVSALQDVRRAVSPAVAARERARYAAARGLDPDDFDRACALLGAQRALRIQGVFARLAKLYGKPHYLDLMPRNWANLMHNLAHPALADLAATVTAAFPAPDAALIARLKEEAA